ncbi:hypothetical protein H1P_1200022 [Hyella patelloides LEGE 07179]|uniref:Uncharacterized protein n=1 Tax=Hyella patelloides LEGE 07179 TaxID=945734 RepID=A0A563VK43_9CYAN|nr:hypothetical protein H1P_1200022 [Hyella patelloides LEGE 07179]
MYFGIAEGAGEAGERGGKDECEDTSLMYNPPSARQSVI